MQAILSSLDRRWRRSTCRMPQLRWQTCLFITCNAVLLSMLLLDAPVGADQVPPAIRRVGRMLTDFGTSGWIIIVSAFLFFEGLAALRLVKSLRTRIQALQMCWIGAYLLISIAASGIVANLIKRAIGRARPQYFDDYGILSFSPFSGHAGFESFPSGHATTIGTFFAALALLFPRYRIVFLACSLWLGMTRVMVRAHYPSDVIAGLALGGWFALMIALVFSRYGILFKAVEGWPVPKRMIRA